LSVCHPGRKRAVESVRGNHRGEVSTMERRKKGEKFWRAEYSGYEKESIGFPGGLQKRVSGNKTFDQILGIGWRQTVSPEKTEFSICAPEFNCRKEENSVVRPGEELKGGKKSTQGHSAGLKNSSRRAMNFSGAGGEAANGSQRGGDQSFLGVSEGVPQHAPALDRMGHP